jgi:hypothetical protein
MSGTGEREDGRPQGAEAPAAVTIDRASPAALDAQRAARAARVAEMRERNAHAAAIRGTQWGKELNGMALSAVAHYCTMNRLDPARHVEVLGGRIYLTGELYEERGVPLVLSGRVVLGEPLFVHHDPELDALIADASDPEMQEWARTVKRERTRIRIQYGIPHDITGGCVYRGRVGETVIVGFNWCGGKSKVKRRRHPKPGEAAEYRGDPVGDAEPVKTAQSRAKRRFWRQVVIALPEYSASMGALEASAKITSEAIEEVTVGEEARAKDAPGGTPSHPTRLLSTGDDPYGPPVTATGREGDPLPVRAAGADVEAARHREEIAADGVSDLGPERTAEDEEFERELEQ